MDILDSYVNQVSSLNIVCVCRDWPTRFMHIARIFATVQSTNAAASTDFVGYPQPPVPDFPPRNHVQIAIVCAVTNV